MSDDPEASTSRCEKQSLELRASTSNRMAAHISELKQVESRLRVLEEEALTLKEALLESVEERAKFMSEIYEDFDTTIRHCLMQRGEVNKGELYGHRFQIGKDTRAGGLLQILCQESNPSVVNKSLSIRTRAAYEFYG